MINRQGKRQNLNKKIFSEIDCQKDSLSKKIFQILISSSTSALQREKEKKIFEEKIWSLFFSSSSFHTYLFSSSKISWLPEK